MKLQCVGRLWAGPVDTCSLHVRKFQSRTRPGPSSGVGSRVSLPPRFHAVTPRPVRTQVLPFPALCLLPGSGEALVPLLGWSAPRPSGAQPRSELADAPLRRHPVSVRRTGGARVRGGRPLSVGHTLCLFSSKPTHLADFNQVQTIQYSNSEDKDRKGMLQLKVAGAPEVWTRRPAGAGG